MTLKTVNAPTKLTSLFYGLSQIKSEVSYIYEGIGKLFSWERYNSIKIFLKKRTENISNVNHPVFAAYDKNSTDAGHKNCDAYAARE